jgi:hypothetical protein
MKNKKVVAPRDSVAHSPQSNSWFALRATNEKIALSGDNSSIFSKMVGDIGFEPITSTTSMLRSSQMS